MLVSHRRSADVSVQKKVIQRNYEKLVDDLDAKSCIDLFFGEEFITFDIKERISNAASTKDANRVFIDDLIKGLSPNRFSIFISLLIKSDSKYKRPKHKLLADKLEEDLRVSYSHCETIKLKQLC